MNESFHTYEWVMVWNTYNVPMSHIWMSYVTQMNELCHTYMNQSCHTFEWVMSHNYMSHITHMNESRFEIHPTCSHTFLIQSGLCTVFTFCFACVCNRDFLQESAAGGASMHLPEFWDEFYRKHTSIDSGFQWYAQWQVWIFFSLLFFSFPSGIHGFFFLLNRFYCKHTSLDSGFECVCPVAGLNFSSPVFPLFPFQVISFPSGDFFLSWIDVIEHTRLPTWYLRGMHSYMCFLPLPMTPRVAIPSFFSIESMLL